MGNGYTRRYKKCECPRRGLMITYFMVRQEPKTPKLYHRDSTTWRPIPALVLLLCCASWMLLWMLLDCDVLAHACSALECTFVVH